MKRIYPVLAAMVGAALILPVAPAVGDDPTPAPIPCDTSDTILSGIAQLNATAFEQQRSIDAIDRTTARQQREIARAYAIINRKNLHVARLERRLHEAKTGLHG